MQELFCVSSLLYLRLSELKAVPSASAGADAPVLTTVWPYLVPPVPRRYRRLPSLL
jgi:hypothetical protein